MKEFDVTGTPLAGTNLIEASAGTGKTYAISVIYLRLIVEKDLKVEEILAVTFTIPATMELRAKIRERLTDAIRAAEGGEAGDATVAGLMKGYDHVANLKLKLTTALKNFDQASVFTIHSFCQQMLADNAFESGSLFNTEIVKEQQLIEQGAADMLRRALYFAPESAASYILDNCDESELVRLYRVRPLSADLRIEPDIAPSDAAEFDRLYVLVSPLYVKLSAAWSAGAEKVIMFFEGSNLLKTSKKRDESLSRLADKMGQYINGGDPFNIFTDFKRYTADEVNKLKHGVMTEEVSAIFDICQSLYRAYNDYLDCGRALLTGIKKQLFEEVDALLLAKKSVSGRRSFDDLIRDAHRGLNGASGGALAARVSSRYRAALIDEFQDTDSMQFEIFDRLFNNEKTLLFLIGDPKQAIYRFRGADIFSYLKASLSVQNRFTLSKNWRSRAELIDALNMVFLRCDNPFLLREIGYRTVSPGKEGQGERFMCGGSPLPPLDIWLEGEQKDPGSSPVLDRLAAEISLLVNAGLNNPYTLEGRRITPADIAVLVRTKNNAVKVRTALSRYGIPSVSRGTGNVLESEEAVALYFIMRAVAEPSNMRVLKTALSTRLLGWSADRLCLEHEEDSAEELGRAAERFYRYREQWVRTGFAGMLSTLMEGESVAERLLSFEGGERGVANISHIAEIIGAEEHKSGYAPKELVSWFAGEMNSQRGDDEYSMRPERDDEAVTIITMHASKGLEFPIVYSLDLESAGRESGRYSIYHDPAEENRTVFHIDGDPPAKAKERRTEEDLAESIRLLYVALTRAKSACRILMAQNRSFMKSPAAYIFIKSPGHEMEKYDRGMFASLLKDLSAGSGGKISFSDGGTLRGERYIAESYDPDRIAAREFTASLSRGWKTHSYSAMAAHSSGESLDSGKDFFAEYAVRRSGGNGIFGFPVGAKAGLCIHEIFEKAPFGLSGIDTVKDICAGAVERYRFAPDSAESLAGMFQNVVGAPLDGAGLRLSSIDEGARLSELEFSFPLEGVSSDAVSAIFSSGGGYCVNTARSLAGGAVAPGGFMKGFIDLVFEYGGRYYIADWKSNHLGNSAGDYFSGALIAEMERHNYFLQYYIYTVALNRYLSMKLNDYDYDRHFGGVYYLFVRGIDPTNGGTTGVFHDIPERKIIEKLDDYFRGER